MFLHKDMVKMATLANGQRCMTFVVGNMKNLVPSLTTIDMALFKQQIVAAAQPEICAIEAFDRQCVLNQRADLAEHNYLFRTRFYWAKTLGATPTTLNTYDGAAKWAKDLLDRQYLTYQDLARRVAITKLANDPEISDYDAAKYLGVTVQTL